MISDFEAHPSRFEDRSLQALFEAQAALTPERIAVVCAGQTLSYRELNERANQLAHHLRACGVRPETLVAVYLERSLDLVVGLLGVLKAGAGYLPIDLESPDERVAFMLRDASVAAIIVHASLAPRLPADAPAVLVIDAERARLAGEPVTDPISITQPSHLAYVMYTSGSTGTPKGVMVEHRSVLGLFHGTEKLYEFDTDDVWTCFHSAAFDVSVWEIWGALLYGARLVIVPRAIARSAEDFHHLCVRERVTVLCQTPSAFVPFMQVDEARHGTGLALRYVIFAGEALDYRMLQRWFHRHADSPRMINMYGITETTVYSTWRLVTARDAEMDPRSLIGLAIPGSHVSVRGDDLRPSAIGETGEICIGGVGVTRGYLNRPELTAERFIHDPLDADPAVQLYRSGDLGRALSGGDIEYIGRRDQQVKIRGYRIEFGEIEFVLRRHDAVAQVVVVVRDDGANDRRLVAYFVRNGSLDVTASALRAHARAHLPEYMVPSVFVELPSLPLTTSGKLNRQALPEPVNIEPDADATFEGPRDETESALAAVWSDVLGRGRVSIHDHFFECGGHSLLVMRATAQIRARLGAEVPVSLIFNHPTIASLAPAIQAIRARALDAGSVDQRLEHHDRAGLPLSFAQRGLWFLDQLNDHRSAYLLPEAWRLQGRPDAEALRAALETIVARHAPLRTRFELLDGEPRQIVDAPRRFDLLQLDLRHLTPAAQEMEVARLIAAESDLPFDLAKDPLLRARLTTLGDDHHVLQVTVHHIASDASSQFLLRGELEELYRAHHRRTASSLPAISSTYGDYAVRELERMTAAHVQQLTGYWRRQLEALPPLSLPTDRPRPHEWSDRGAELEFEIDSGLLAELERLAAANQVTLQMLLVTAHAVLLARYSGQSDFAMATFTAGRPDTDVESLIGLFVNTLVLRADLSGDPTFVQALQRMRSVSLDAYDHQALPFETLVAELRPERGTGTNPFAQVAFQFLSIADSPPALEGLDVASLPQASERVRFEMETAVSRQPTCLRVVIAYSTVLFDRSTVARFAEGFRTLLAGAVAMPDCSVNALPLLTDAERDVQLLEWSGASGPAATLGCVHELFAERANERPDATALVLGDRRLSYAQLDARSTRLARHLRAIGAGAQTIVGLHLDRSIELVVAMLGVLKAGAAYVPLDPSYPAGRLAFMMRDLQVETLIAGPSVPSLLSSAAQHVLALTDGDDDWPDSALPTPATVKPSDLAYVMFTSGSTGQPKGVGVPHQAITRLVRHTNYIDLQASDRIAHAANVGFDAATFEIWGALLNGAEVVGLDRDTILSPTRLAEAIQARGITVLFLTTALFHQVAAASPSAFSPLRYLVVGGEAIDPILVTAVLAAAPPRHFLNGYGPTENTTFSTWAELTTFDGTGRVPIGRPIAGSTCYVLSPQQRLLPAGASGELYVGGSGLADGYIRRPELTAERFVAHPFAAGERLYRTGDRVRWRADGQLEFLGRFDLQVKLRGHRIELEEIEHALSSCEGVDVCAVRLADERTDHARIVAYWVGHAGVALTGETLRDHLRRRLPSYMVPAAFVRLPALPLTVNGKVNHAALPAALVRPLANGRGFSEPATALEKTVAAAFRDVLGLDRVGRHQSFFDLGGTSLSVFRMADRIKAGCGRAVLVADVFSHPTVAELARILETAHATNTPTSIVEVRRGGSRTPLYFPPGVLGEVLVYKALVDALPPDQPVYAFTDPAGRALLTPSIEAMAARFCDELQAFQPTGPICLAGYSFSGLLAFEMARQLMASGRQIQLLAIFDTGPDLSDNAGVRGNVAAVGRFLVNLPRWIAEDLVRTFGKDTPARLARSMRKNIRSIGRRARRPEAGQTHDRVQDIFDVREWSRPLRAHVENNLVALAAFRYRPYPGRVVLLRARVRPLFNSHGRDLGWGSLVREVSVIDVPGNHHSITTEPNVRVLAQALRTAVEGAFAPRD